MKKKKRLSKPRIIKNLSNKVIILSIIIIISLIYLLWPQKGDPLTFDFGDLSYVEEVNGEFSIRVPCNITNISEKEIRVKKVTVTLINMTSRDSTFWEEPSTPMEFKDFELLLQSKETIHKYLESSISWVKDPVLATVKYTFYLEPNDVVIIQIVKLQFPPVYVSEIDFVPSILEAKISDGNTILIIENKIRNNSPMDIHISQYSIKIENATTKDGFVIHGPDKESKIVQYIIGKGSEFIVNNELLFDVMGKELTEINILFDCWIEEANGGVRFGLNTILIKQDDEYYSINQERQGD